MTGRTFDLKPCRSRYILLDRSSKLIWVDPYIFMYTIQSNVVPHMCLIRVLDSEHGKVDV